MDKDAIGFVFGTLVILTPVYWVLVTIANLIGVVDDWSLLALPFALILLLPFVLVFGGVT